MRARSCILTSLLLLASLGLPAGPVYAEPDKPSELILEITVDRFTASQGIVAYLVDNRVMLPLGELSAALGLAISVDPYGHRARGWIITENRTFDLELDQGRITLDGRQDGVPADAAFADDADIYVATNVLSQWLPADFVIDMRSMRVDVRPRETLPLMARLKRDKIRAQMLARRPGAILFPERRGEYRAVAWPILDGEFGYHRDPSGDLYRGSILARGDLARLSANGFIAARGGIDHDVQGWFRAGRTDPDGDLIGPLHATRYDVGDIFAAGMPFVTKGKRGRGFMVSNRRLGSSQSFDSTDIFGNAPPGWEIELYVNGNLFDFATTDATGQFEFREVPIYCGTNVLRTVYYGPQGQSREDVRSVYVGPGMSRRGQLFFEAYSLQDERSIFGGNLWSHATADHGIWNHHVEVGYGLTSSLSANASVSRVSNKGEPQDLANLTVYKSVGPIVLQSIYARDLAAGSALRLAGQGRVFHHSLYLEQDFFDNFETEAYDTYDGSKSETNARVSANVGVMGLPLSYQFRYRNRTFDSGTIDRAVQYQGRLSTNMHGLMFGHEIELRRNLASQGATDYGTGTQLVSGYWGRWRVNGDLGYGFASHAGLQSAGAMLQWRPNERLNAHVSARRYFEDRPYGTIDTDVTWTLDQLLAGISVGFNTRGTWQIGLSVAVSLTRAPRTGKWIVSGTRSSNYGAAMARTFIDADGDGRYSAADQPLPGVAFRRNRRWQGVATSDEGLAFLAGLSPDRFQNIELDLDSVADPFLIPDYKGLTTLAHSGGVVDLDFPFFYAGEIEGLVVRDEAMQHPMRNIGLELLDSTGQRVATAVSEFDGYYLLQRVRPGSYTLGIVEATVPGDDYIIPPPQKVGVPLLGDFVQGPTFILKRIGKETEVVAAPVDTAKAKETVVATVTPAKLTPQDTRPPATPKPSIAEPEHTPAPVVTTPPDTTVTTPPATLTPKPAPITPPPTRTTTPELAEPAFRANVEPDYNRTMHLIYEILFAGELFPDED